MQSKLQCSRWPLALALGLAASRLGGANQASSGAADPERTAMAVEALTRLQGIDLDQNPKIRQAVLKVLEKTRGTGSFVKLVQQFKLTDQDPGLLEVAVENATNETGVAAMRLLLANKDLALLQTALEGTNMAVAAKTAQATRRADRGT